MAKFTKREYRNMAKRPGQKGFGFPQRRKKTEEDWAPVPEKPKGKSGPKKTRFERSEDVAEAVRPDATDEAEPVKKYRKRNKPLENPMGYGGSTIDGKASERDK